jgi:tight adherence protein B
VRAYASGLGFVVLAVGGALTVLAYWSMLRIGRLPEDERVLR